MLREGVLEKDPPDERVRLRSVGELSILGRGSRMQKCLLPFHLPNKNGVRIKISD